MLLDLLLYLGMFIVSLAVLLKASDWFVNAAERIGLSLGISPFIVGVTIIAFGTSLPELASSIAAVFLDESEVVVGNVVGSNITNILLVLGLIAVIGKEVRLGQRVMSVDIPLLVFSSFFLWFALRDRDLSIAEALLFILSLAIFLVNSFRGGHPFIEQEPPKVTWRSYAMLVIGAALVYLSADYTMVAIKQLSQSAGIDTGVIALTLVALGTSLPEVIVSLTAARKGKTSIAVGNVLGSNIFNTYAVMGVPAFIGPLDIPADILTFSLPFMVAATVIFSIICITNKITRMEGIMLLIFYAYFLIELARTAL
jgi:cation:H+ antiporter